MARDDEKPMMNGANRYVDDDSSSEQGSDHIPITRRKDSALRKGLWWGFIVLPWMMLCVLGISYGYSVRYYRDRYYVRPDLTYSPMQDVVKYETKIFTTGQPEDPDISLYAQEPSDEVDELWKGLYPALYQLVPQEQAAKLVNKTSLFPHDDQRRYIIEIDVFHQLHCLNMVRKATRPDYYGVHGDEDPLLSPRHIAHCIDAIRQSLMCSSDITVYTWQWDEEKQYHANQVKNPHVCRNFDDLREWSVANSEQIYPDFDYRELNDPLDPSTWVNGYAGE